MKNNRPTRGLFQLPGGKHFLKGEIAKAMPPHRVYIEPFVGAGSVFFAKKPSPVEIIGDADSDLIYLYKYIQKHSSPPDTKLTTISRSKFEYFKSLKPKAGIKRIERILVMAHYSYRHNRKHYQPSQKTIIKDSWLVKNWRRYHERLQGVTILHQDYRKTVKAYDAKDAFTYLDPPYEEGLSSDSTQATKSDSWYGLIDLSDMKKLTDTIKGKYILSFADTDKARKLYRGAAKVKDVLTISNSNRNGINR